MMTLLSYAWHFVFGWAGVDILIGIACIAVALLEPPFIAVLIPDLRKWAIAGAVVAFTLTGAISYGYRSGITVTKADWDAALVAEAAKGDKILSDAERAAASDTPDRVRNDPWNRDNWLRGSQH